MPLADAALVIAGSGPATPFPDDPNDFEYGGSDPSPARKSIVVVPLDEPVTNIWNVTVAPQLAPGARVRPAAQGAAPLPTALKPSPVVAKFVIVYVLGNAVVFESLVKVKAWVTGVPTVTLPKAIEVGESEDGIKMPLPTSVTTALKTGFAPNPA